MRHIVRERIMDIPQAFLPDLPSQDSDGCIPDDFHVFRITNAMISKTLFPDQGCEPQFFFHMEREPALNVLQSLFQRNI